MSLEYWDLSPLELTLKGEELLKDYTDAKHDFNLAYKSNVSNATKNTLSRRCTLLDLQRSMIMTLQQYWDQVATGDEMVFIVTSGNYDCKEVKFTSLDAREAFNFYLLERDGVDGIEWYKLGRN